MFKKIIGICTVLILLGCNNEEEQTEETENTQEVTGEDTNGEDTTQEQENEDQESEFVSFDLESVTYQRERFIDGEWVMLDMQVGPIVRDGELAVLPIAIETDDSIEVRFSDLFSLGVFTGEGIASEQGFDIRLIDSQEMSVSHTAVLPTETFLSGALHLFTGEGVRINQETISPEKVTRYYAVFSAPESDQVQVMMRLLDVFDYIPVVNRDEYDIATFSEIEQTVSEEDLLEANNILEDSVDELVIPSVEEVMQAAFSEEEIAAYEDTILDAIDARTASLETYREILETSVSRIDEEEQSTLTLSSDVLFDFDSSELMAEADNELNAVINELQGVEGGELEIIGHTDDEHTEEYNQELSEDRAEAVRNRLEELSDLSVFDNIVVRGESFREPIADNETEEGRAQNRRVELLFSAPTETIEIEEVEIGVPDSLGEEVAYPEVAQTEDGTVEVVSLRRVDNVLIGRLRVENEEAPISVYQALTAFATGARGYYNIDTVGYMQWSAYAPTLLHGNYRYYPLDYYQTPLSGTFIEGEIDEEEERPFLVPLAERTMPQSVQAFEATVIWPALDSDEVTIDLTQPDLDSVDITEGWIERTSPWRITNVPVEEEDGQ